MATLLVAGVAIGLAGSRWAAGRSNAVVIRSAVARVTLLVVFLA